MCACVKGLIQCACIRRIEALSLEDARWYWLEGDNVLRTDRTREIELET